MGTVAPGTRPWRSGWRPDDLDEFIPIPAGPFFYGDEKMRVVIEAPFSIARYPVTNLQYRFFIDEGGYHQPEWWGEEGWAWRQGDYDSQAPDSLKDWLAQRPPERRSEPYFWRQSQWNNPLAPVVGVTWFEAQAYCAWLSLVAGRAYRLPSEVEWEAAARSGDGRLYPWGSEWDPAQANTLEGRVLKPSPVGAYAAAGGLGPFGAEDQSGNVWEWTASLYRPYPSQDELDPDAEGERVLRGGGWYDVRRGGRCASRDRVIPVYFFNLTGFRVVSPGIFLDAES